jgi:hypothetical protein
MRKLLWCLVGIMNVAPMAELLELIDTSLAQKFQLEEEAVVATSGCAGYVPGLGLRSFAFRRPTELGGPREFGFSHRRCIWARVGGDGNFAGGVGIRLMARQPHLWCISSLGLEPWRRAVMMC